MREAGRFTYRAYLSDRWASLLMVAICIVSVWVILASFGVDTGSVAFVAAFIFCCAAVGTTLDYLRRRRFWRELGMVASEANEAAQIASLVGQPTFLEAACAEEAIEAMGALARSEVFSARKDAEDYKSFIELWIHETKTPITTAKLIAQRLEGADANSILLELEHVDREVEKALYLARSSSVASDYEIVDVDLGDVCHEACMRNARFLIEKQCIPSFDVRKGTSVLSDKSWLTFMLGQVVVNAAQYGASKIAFSAEVEEDGTPRGHTTLRVSDDGKGIAEADMPRIFDKGFTGKNGRARGNATGMGLYLLAVMCSSLGIGLSISSEEGAGTTVCLSFPHDRRHKSIKR